MGIYSSQALGSVRNTVEVEPQFYSESMSIIETTYCILAESEANWNTFMKAVGMQELAHLEAYGEEMVYTEGAVGDFFARAKDWFKKLFAKVKGLFEKFVAKIRSFISSDSSFVSKYEDKIREGAGKIPSNAEFKGYPFTNVHKFVIPNTITPQGSDIAIDKKYQSMINDMKSASMDINDEKAKIEDLKRKLREIKDDKEKELDEIRGLLVNQKSVSSSDFSNELDEYLRGDKDTFDDRYLSDYTTFISEIKTSKETIRKAQDDFETVKNNINGAIREVEELEAYTKKRKEEKAGIHDRDVKYDLRLSYASYRIEKMKDILVIYTTANGKHLECLKAYNRQCKAICVKLVGFASRTSTSESAYYQSERPVSGIQLV